MAGSERAEVGTTKRPDDVEKEARPNFDFIEATLGKVFGSEKEERNQEPKDGFGTITGGLGKPITGLESEARISNDPAKVAAWENAKANFLASTKDATELINENGGGEAVRAQIESGTKTLREIVGEFQRGERGLPVEETPAKQVEEERIRKALSCLSPEALAKAIKGKASPADLEDLRKVFTNEEKELFDKIAILDEKVNHVARETLKHAAEASKMGFESGDRTVKASATRVLRQLKADDPTAFTDSPYAAELKGALTQTQRKEMVDLSNGKAAAVGYSQEARDLRAVEYGGSTKERDIINNLAMAQLANAEQAQIEQQRVMDKSSTGWGNFTADATGLAATLLTAHGLNLAHANLAKVLPVVAKLDPRIATGVTIGTGLIAGGMTNNYMRDESLSAVSGFGRNTFVAGLTVGAMKGLNSLPDVNAASALAHTGRLTGALGVGATYGAAYKGMTIAAGDRIEGANYRDPAQWGSEMAWAAGKGAAYTLLFATAIKPAGAMAEAALPNNMVGNALKHVGVGEIASGAVASSTFMLAPLHDRITSSYESNLNSLRSEQARKMLESHNKITSKMATQIPLERK